MLNNAGISHESGTIDPNILLNCRGNFHNKLPFHPTLGSSMSFFGVTWRHCWWTKKNPAASCSDGFSSAVVFLGYWRSMNKTERKILNSCLGEVSPLEILSPQKKNCHIFMQWRSFRNDQLLLSASPPPKRKSHPSFPENGAKRFMDKNPIAAEAVT